VNRSNQSRCLVGVDPADLTSCDLELFAVDGQVAGRQAAEGVSDRVLRSLEIRQRVRNRVRAPAPK